RDLAPGRVELHGRRRQRTQRVPGREPLRQLHQRPVPLQLGLAVRVQRRLHVRARRLPLVTRAAGAPAPAATAPWPVRHNRGMRITVVTGAGMSAESGVPTFRDAPEGLWARFDPQQLATPEAFSEDPALVWGWYRWRAALVLRAQPNAGHAGIVRLQDAGHDVTVVTQNVDDLHERAGSDRVLHLHGSLFASRCSRCAAAPAAEPLRQDLEAVPPEGAHEAPPACATCGGLVRPGVVWFGEGLPADAWRQAQEAVAASELVLVIGTSN